MERSSVVTDTQIGCMCLYRTQCRIDDTECPCEGRADKGGPTDPHIQIALHVGIHKKLISRDNYLGAGGGGERFQITDLSPLHLSKTRS